MSKPTDHKGTKAPRKRRKIWKLFLWALLVLVILAAILLYWIWSNRLAIVQERVVAELENRGFEVELTLEELLETQAVARDIRISKDGRQLLSADRLDVQYIWRDAMEGRFERVEISGPEVTLKINEAGEIENPLGRSGSGGGIWSLPPAGIFVKNGQVTIDSPVGKIISAVDADILGQDQMKARLNLEPAKIAYGDISGTLVGQIDLNVDGQDRAANLNMIIPQWQYKNMSGAELSMSGKSELTMTDSKVALSGPLVATLKRFRGKAVEAEGINLNWDGELGLTRGERSVVLAHGDWSAAIEAFRVTDATTRSALADTITLRNSMASTPVTRDFAAPLKTSVAELLKNASIKGQGEIRKSVDTTLIDLSAPLIWQSPRNQAVIHPVENTPEYLFSRAESELALRLEAELGGAYPLNIKDGKLVFRSTNGRNIKDTQGFTGQVRLPRAWRAKTPEGRLAEIRPVSAHVDYRGGAGPRRLKLSGQLDYDGDIPGGYAETLKADGHLDVRLGERTNIYFTPRNNAQISMRAFYNPTEWTASNVTFNLKPLEQIPLFTTENQKGRLQASLNSLTADLANSDNTRTLNFNFGEADISADITEEQVWEILGRDVTMTSDNTPSAGTVMTTPSTTIRAVVRPDQSPEFTIDAPKADVKTNAVDAKGLAVQVAGTPETFRVDYQNGAVDFLATEFPAFDMTGFVNFENEQFIGKAETVLPYDGKTPAFVDYRFVDSRGYAQVEIPELDFSPYGLQPQSLIPALQGKIADVYGLASAHINLEFSDADGVVSSGRAKLVDMDMSTAPGPLSGLNAELNFSSFFPLVTEGPQTVTIKSWDVGVPLPDGVIKFLAVPDGIDVISAKWPVGKGEVSLEPAHWSYTAAENRMTLRMKDVSIGELLGEFGGDSFEMTGNVSGVLPVVISGIAVEVENGQLAVTDGGVVRFSTPFTDKAGESSGYAQLAFDSLKEFYYEKLEFSINGPLDGIVSLRMVFDGFNPNVMEGAYIRYNINIEGELFNIINNFQRLGAKITDEVKRVVLEDENLDE